jgi:hypothetical protein
VVLFYAESTAQHTTHDIGVFAGLSIIQTDFGQRDNFKSSAANGSLSLTVAHYMHFFNQERRWNSDKEVFNNLMVKTELSYVTNNTFQHHGFWTELAGTDLARQLNAMTSTINMFVIGVQLEYYLNNLEEFIYPYSDSSFNPYFTFGLKYAFYNNKLTSTLGDWESDITLLPVKYRTPGALAVGSGGALAFTMGLGTRYKLTDKLDLSAQFQWQTFFSDAIDGLQADVIENKNNEWATSFQFGVVYHLNFNEPLFDK